MTTNYGSIKVGSRSGRISNGDCRYDIVGYVEITLKGRKYFKYLEVVYQKKTFYGFVPRETTIDDLFLDGMSKFDGRLVGVYIRYGDQESQVVECRSESILTDPEVIRNAKASYYDEILFELDGTWEGVGGEHVNEILAALQDKKTLESNNILELASTLHYVQLQNVKLTDENKQLSLLHERNNYLSSNLANTVTKLEQQVRELVIEPDALKKENAVLSAGVEITRIGADYLAKMLTDSQQQANKLKIEVDTLKARLAAVLQALTANSD